MNARAGGGQRAFLAPDALHFGQPVSAHWSEQRPRKCDILTTPFRLEDADYDGHSLAMLRRIASALEKRVEIRFVPSPKLQHA